MVVEIDGFTATTPNRPTNKKMRPTPGSKSSTPICNNNPHENNEDKFEFSEERLNTLYGMETGTKLEGKKWQNRKDALDVMRIQISNRSEKIEENSDLHNDTDTDYINSTFYVLKKALEDPVLPVYLASLDLIKGFLEAYGNKLVYEDIKEPFVQVTESLIKKVNNNNPRIVRETCSVLLLISRLNKINGLGVISQLLANEEFPIRGRLTLLRLLIPECEFRKGCGLTLPMVMKIVIPSLEIADDKIRRLAVGVVVDCYNIKGDTIYNSLSGIKPALMKIIHRKIAESRGISTSSQLPPLANSLRPNTVNNDLPVNQFDLLKQYDNRITQSAPSSDFNQVNNVTISPVKKQRIHVDSLLDEQDEQLMDEILNM